MQLICIDLLCAQSTQKCRSGEANPIPIIPTEGSRSSTNKITRDSCCSVFPSEASQQEGLSNSPVHWLCMNRLKEYEGIANGKLTTPSNLIKVIPWHSFTNVLLFESDPKQKTTATKWLSLEISMLSTLTYPSLRRRFDNGVGAVQTRNVCAAHRGRRCPGAACFVSTAGVISMACDPCVNSWQREIFQQAMISWLQVYCSSLTDKQPNQN